MVGHGAILPQVSGKHGEMVHSWPYRGGIPPFLRVEWSHAGAEPDGGRGRQQGVGLAQSSHGDLALDELGGALGSISASSMVAACSSSCSAAA